MRFQTLRRACLVPAVLLLVTAGCSKAPVGSVTGEVTHDGKPLSYGEITFTPSDGKGPVVGGPVKDGKFDVPNVPPGPKVVTVQASLPPTTGEVSSGDTYAKGAKAEAAAPLHDAVGNGLPLDVVAGPQTFKVTLTTTKR